VRGDRFSIPRLTSAHPWVWTQAAQQHELTTAQVMTAAPRRLLANHTSASSRSPRMRFPHGADLDIVNAHRRVRRGEQNGSIRVRRGRDAAGAEEIVGDQRRRPERAVVDVPIVAISIAAMHAPTARAAATVSIGSVRRSSASRTAISHLDANADKVTGAPIARA